MQSVAVWSLKYYDGKGAIMTGLKVWSSSVIDNYELEMHGSLFSTSLFWSENETSNWHWLIRLIFANMMGFRKVPPGHYKSFFATSKNKIGLQLQRSKKICQLNQSPLYFSHSRHDSNTLSPIQKCFIRNIIPSKNAIGRVNCSSQLFNATSLFRHPHLARKTPVNGREKKRRIETIVVPLYSDKISAPDQPSVP